MDELSFALPRSASVHELATCFTEIFRLLGQQLGEFVDKSNRHRHGSDWFAEYCRHRVYRPNLYDPEFLLKEPDDPETMCRWCLPSDSTFHATRRRLKKQRNRWAHFEEFPPEDLAAFLADVRSLAAALDLPLASLLPRLQQHVRQLLNDPDLVLSDTELDNARSELAAIRSENDRLSTEVAKYAKWFPQLSTFESGSDSETKADEVCLHFAYDGHGHNVRARRIPETENLAEMQFQLNMEIPLGEGDVVAFREVPGGTCASLTAIVERAPVYRVLLCIDVGTDPLLVLQGAQTEEFSEGEVEQLLQGEGGPEERWNAFWLGLNEILGDSANQCAVVADELFPATAVIEVASEELAQEVIEAAQLQDDGDAWLLSTPQSPSGSLSSLDRFNYRVATERLIAEAIRRNWFTDADESTPDLNRVLMELEWEPVSDFFYTRQDR